MLKHLLRHLALTAVLTTHLSCIEVCAAIDNSAPASLAMVGVFDSTEQPRDAQTRPPNNEWIALPEWLAGKWQTKFQTFLNCYDYRTGHRSNQPPTTISVNRQRVLGTQKDGRGQIWHFTGTPYTRVSGTHLYTEIQRIDEVKLIYSCSNEVKVRTVGSVSRWSVESAQLLDRFREVTVATYMPLGDGVIKTDLTIVDYDENGEPIRTAQSVCIENRSHPFVNIDRDERGDLKERFLHFMDGR